MVIGGRTDDALAAALSLLLIDLWHIPRKLLKATTLFAVMNERVALFMSTATAAPLTRVLDTREVNACP